MQSADRVSPPVELKNINYGALTLILETFPCL